MTGPLILIAVLVASPALPAAAFRPVGGTTARASASIRVISGVSVGHGRSAQVPGATRRATRLIDAERGSYTINLLEFQ